MKRSDVLNLVGYLPPERTATSNFNSVYWLDIPVHKIEADGDLFLCLIRQHKLDIFKVPTSFLREGFKLYKKDQTVQLEILPFSFKDRKGPGKKDFTPFLHESRDIV